MTAQGEMIGILHVQAHSGMGLERLEQTALTAAARIGMVLVNLRLKERLTFQSLRDPLTGLFNRRYMEVTFGRELRRAIRDRSPLGVVTLAVDHYEHIKKVYGSETGDAVLKEVGAYLQANVRGEDIVCRMEGEEFNVILPKASLEITNRRAEQFRKGIAELVIAHIGQSIGPVSVSAGTAGFPEHGSGTEAIFKAAEAALQRAKREGFDRVVSA
jgi:diguanylate cyclase (GGDEF)-like protein